MAFDFPNSPALNQTYTIAGITYIWDGEKWKIRQPAMPPLQTAQRQNLVVNGWAQISQETAFATVVTANGAYIVDQWFASYSGPTALTHIQYVAQPGSGNFPTTELRIVTGNTAYTATADSYAGIGQYIEGQTFAPVLNWGRAEAIPAVLAFDAFCSVAGTYAAVLRSGNADRSIAFPVTFAAGEVNTWKRFTFPVPAITSGTFARDATKGMTLWFTAVAGTTWQTPAAGVWQNGNYLGVPGQSNLLATTGAFLSIRKVSLHPDPDGTGIAPPAEMPDHASELIRCKRYWQQVYLMFSGYTTAGGAGHATTNLPVMPRAAPTLTGVHYGASNFPTTAGPLVSMYTYGLYEYRLATAAALGYFQTNVTASARM